VPRRSNVAGSGISQIVCFMLLKNAIAPVLSLRLTFVCSTCDCAERDVLDAWVGAGSIRTWTTSPRTMRL
jgi:hypothetical protein